MESNTEQHRRLGCRLSLHQLFTRTVEKGHAAADATAVTRLFEGADRVGATKPVDESLDGY